MRFSWNHLHYVDFEMTTFPTIVNSKFTTCLHVEYFHDKKQQKSYFLFISMYIKWQLYCSPYSQWQRVASWLPPHGRAHSFAICHQNLAGLICASCHCSNSQEPMLLPINDRMKNYTVDKHSRRYRLRCMFMCTCWYIPCYICTNDNIVSHLII